MARDGGEHGVDVLDEVERLAVEEHVLLLDAERVRVALAEGVVEHAAAGRKLEPLPVIDGGISESVMRGPYSLALQEESALVRQTASASISTCQRGSRSPATTTIVEAGRTSPKTSPCARPIASQSAASVT